MSTNHRKDQRKDYPDRKGKEKRWSSRTMGSGIWLIQSNPNEPFNTAEWIETAYCLNG
jgi:hypothetical protein